MPCSEHTNFAESTEEIAPLTEEEKKEKLAELRAKAAERKLKQSATEKEEQKRNEVCPTSYLCTTLPLPNHRMQH